MRRITLWLLSTVAAVVLAFSYRTSTMGAAGGETVSVAAPPTTGPTGIGGSPEDDGTTEDDGPTGNAVTPETTGNARSYAGSVVQTRWGPIQVTITVTGGKITDVAVPTYPSGNHRDEEINAYALPVLRQAVLDTQSAHIDTVSGATVTSDGYKQSLQAAIDAAHLR